MVFSQPFPNFVYRAFLTLCRLPHAAAPSKYKRDRFVTQKQKKVWLNSLGVSRLFLKRENWEVCQVFAQTEELEFRSNQFPELLNILTAIPRISSNKLKDEFTFGYSRFAGGIEKQRYVSEMFSINWKRLKRCPLEQVQLRKCKGIHVQVFYEKWKLKSADRKSEQCFRHIAAIASRQPIWRPNLRELSNAVAKRLQIRNESWSNLRSPRERPLTGNLKFSRFCSHLLRAESSLRNSVAFIPSPLSLICNYIPRCPYRPFKSLRARSRPTVNCKTRAFSLRRASYVCKIDREIVATPSRRGRNSAFLSSHPSRFFRFRLSIYLRFKCKPPVVLF